MFLVNTLMRSYLLSWKRSFDFKGLSSRHDFWWFFATNLIVIFLLGILSAFATYLSIETLPLGPGGNMLIFASLTEILDRVLYVVERLYVIAQFVPSASMQVRRLRDIGRAWWWTILFYIPILNLFMTLLWFTKPSKRV